VGRVKAAAIDFARLADGGVAVCGAMGNEYLEGNPIEYPAGYSDVIAVGSVGATLARSAFSNTGAHIALSAPGEAILSTLPRKPSSARAEIGSGVWDGTSMATPHVAAAVAMRLHRSPTSSLANVRKRLAKGARRLPGQVEPWTRTSGAGLLYLPTTL
jgi:subtilisin